MNVLVVDDDRDFLETLARILTGHAYTVACTDCAKEAAAMVKDFAFDFVLVDYRLPENDGIWFMQNAELPRHTKVLLVTAYVNREVINKMFSLGAVGYLIKPFEENELVRHLEFYAKHL